MIYASLLLLWHSAIVLCAGGKELKSQTSLEGDSSEQISLHPGFARDRPHACPQYQHYSATRHWPLSKGPLHLPSQRPSERCRTFHSPLVERVIHDITSRMTDADLARLFENAFPNTLDTTISWHNDGTEKLKYSAATQKKLQAFGEEWRGPQSFVVTGDINAEWLRDSTNQLQGYQPLAKKDKTLFTLILGAINTQVEFVIQSPYCNAFQPPPPSGLEPVRNAQDDVHPIYDPSVVFECKYEIDSLAHFLRLGNEFFDHTGSADFLTKRWYAGLKSLIGVLDAQAEPTFDPKTGLFKMNDYRFRRTTSTGTETLNLNGIGNPIAPGTGLIRSAFRPSDDATTLPFFIPGNAMMAVELRRTAKILKSAGKSSLSADLEARSKTIEAGVKKHGIVHREMYGDVYAFEVDGYGSQIMMDDANIPSLLALPLLGFVKADDPVYQNTRRMILEQQGNPYYLTGEAFSGIGGPHIGLENAWPMSRLVQAMTSDDDAEISASLEAVKKTSLLGLIHESINVEVAQDYTRSWFAWANSVFAQTILDIAERKPHLIFGKDAAPYTLRDVEAV